MVGCKNFLKQNIGYLNMDVSIIIVNYNTKALTLECLNSVYKQTKNLVFEVFVSDNGSIDGSVEAIRKQFPQVHLIENKANLGFGAANNRALEKAKGKYVFYLNSDTLLKNNAVRLFFDYWENASNKAQIGALGCRLQNKEGEYIHSGASFPAPKEQLHLLLTNIISCYIFRWIPHKAKKRFNHSSIGRIEYVTGADLFMLNTEDARYDESYFMYCEEVDLQKRLALKGKYSYLIDGPQIIHLEGASSGKKKVTGYRFNTFSSVNIWNSNVKFLEKYYKGVNEIGTIKMLLKMIYKIPNNKKAWNKYINK